MRKLLFLSFALVCALSGNAQKVVLKDGRITKQQIVDLPNQKMERSADVKRVGPNRTVANSVYYTIPGALFAGWDTEGSGYIYSMAEVPPFVDVTFANQATDKFAGRSSGRQVRRISQNMPRRTATMFPIILLKACSIRRYSSLREPMSCISSMRITTG